VSILSAVGNIVWRTRLLDSQSIAYHKRLRAKVEQLLGESDTFLNLCASMEGAFPVAVRDELRRLVHSPKSQQATRLLVGAETARLDAQLQTEGDPNLLVDFDWRFQRESAERVCAILAGFGRVVCIGTPTIFARLSSDRCNDALIDQNPHCLRGNGVHRERIFSVPIQLFNSSDLYGKFDAAIIDPPWYLQDYREWLHASLQMVRLGGAIFFPMFPGLIRETAEQEARDLTQWLSQFGSVTALPFKVFYETPTFEIEVLRKHNLPPLHGWRSAPFLCLTVNERNVPSAPPRRTTWERFDFGVVSVAVRTALCDEELPSEETVFFLDSVSNRDLRRKTITAISSRNLATNSRNVAAITDQLRLLQFEGGACSVDPLLSALRNLGVPRD
jgi:hypothetical protein